MTPGVAYGPLFSLKLSSLNLPPPEFWEAAAHCRKLKSLHMHHAYFPFAESGPPFWKICRSVETLSVFDSEDKDCLLVHIRMLRLKHLTMVRSYVRSERAGWQSAKSWLCSPNLETLCYNRSYTSSSDDEFHEMVDDIKAATAAAAAGKNYYALDLGAHAADELDEDMEKYRGLIPGKKLHSLETDRDNIMDEDLGFLVDNMETLRRFCLPNLSLGPAAIGALGRHHRTIVELDLRGSTNGSRVLKTVMSLTQLEVLALDLVDVEAFVQSDTWACLGLKRLSIAFQILCPSNIATEIAPESSRAIWQRLSCLTRLEHLNTYKCGFWMERFRPFFTLECGLELLSTLTELRRVEADLNVLATPEAEWMIGAWPKLNLVHCGRQQWDCKDVDPKVVQAFKDKSIAIETLPRTSFGQRE
ncbi:hypothetical protein BGZ81_008897 [Podila clonocystis]|nr:hypothetical protein BGZ81_008897 [Podila clonocystis]